MHLLYVNQESITGLIPLKSKLNRLGYGTKDTVFCATSACYTAQVEDFEHLKNSPAIVVANCDDTPLDTSHIIRLTAAMLWSVPIILTHTPKFSNDVPSYYKDIILKRLNKVIIADLYSLDETDTLALLQNIVGDKLNYVLASRERVLIRSQLRQYFAHLLSNKHSQTAQR